MFFYINFADSSRLKPNWQTHFSISHPVSKFKPTKVGFLCRTFFSSQQNAKIYSLFHNIRDCSPFSAFNTQFPLQVYLVVVNLKQNGMRTSNCYDYCCSGSACSVSILEYGLCISLISQQKKKHFCISMQTFLLKHSSCPMKIHSKAILELDMIVHQKFVIKGMHKI